MEPKPSVLDVVLALDPGKTTGACLMVVKDNVVCRIATQSWSKPDLYQQFDNQAWNRITAVAIEDFRLYPWLAKQQAFRQMEAPKVIGLIEYLAFKAGLPLHFYLAGTYKPRTKPEDLRELGYKLRGIPEHEKDALRLALYHISKIRGRIPECPKSTIILKT